MAHLDGLSEWENVGEEVAKEIDEFWTCEYVTSIPRS